MAYAANVEEIIQLLKFRDLGHLEQSFRTHRINGAALMALTEPIMADTLQITSFGDQVQLTQMIADLKPSIPQQHPRRVSTNVKSFVSDILALMHQHGDKEDRFFSEVCTVFEAAMEKKLSSARKEAGGVLDKQSSTISVPETDLTHKKRRIDDSWTVSDGSPIPPLPLPAVEPVQSTVITV